jgi:uncharacterized protein with GYD domain
MIRAERPPHGASSSEKAVPVNVYQASYTADSLAAQIKDPQDRLQAVGRQIESSGVKFAAGGFTFGEYDVLAILDAPSDVTVAAVALSIGAGGVVRSARTTRLLSGGEWVEALKKAGSVGYRPAR